MGEALAGPAAATQAEVLDPRWAPAWAAAQPAASSPAAEEPAAPAVGESSQAVHYHSSSCSSDNNGFVHPAPKAALWPQAQAGIAREDEVQDNMQVMRSCARSRRAAALLSTGWRPPSWPEQPGSMMISNWHSAEKRLRTQQLVQQQVKQEPAEDPAGPQP